VVVSQTAGVALDAVWTLDVPTAFDAFALVALAALDAVCAAAVPGFGPLADPVRRRVLSLLDEEGSLTCEELAARIAAADDASPVEADRLRVRLAHVHLPKLHVHGHVEYDPRMGDVRRRTP